MTAGEVLQRLYDRTGYFPRGAGADKIARCPNPRHGQGRGDRNPSMSVRVEVNRVLIHCHVCGDGGFPLILDALGLGEADLLADARPAHDGVWTPCGHGRAEEYEYRDEHGTVLYGVTRCVRKCFAQWRPDGASKSGRRWSLKDAHGHLAVRLVPYRLAQLRAALADERNIWIAEGEKDVHALVARNLPATCNSGGAGKWTAAHAGYLAGADVMIVADRDPPGREHAELVVATLMPLARSIEVVQAAHGKDAYDHFAAGATVGGFVTVWNPKPYPLETR